ncbi:biotin-dependent carboxyltransferase family protein [Pusillimonas sp. MFBS29]|uniref:5-oxoprolinase subunit C family protein n=1 Tax=Pusillimonas sp. MFBS29 TaxID=2886690 RepID=UPI001D10B8BF|nr:biotin-dependent carboxyltransferase family protein [Pusillimonas sp. MFBS29]MCC2597585.1 biotin-dependent carboxyltransferase family protein [Pusillimonas sp. MFBS29]
MSIRVIKPGMLSSFQDLGRTGHQHLGVPVGGAMDSRAHRLANLLVGNDENEATLEITLTGPTLQFDAPACIAICGAQLNPTLNDEPLPNNRPIIVRSGDVLAFGARASGLRAYIAWHGGIDLPVVMSSRSTYLPGSFGGYHGRALRKGDTLALTADLSGTDLDALAHELWQLKIYLPAILGLNNRSAIRAVLSAEASLFKPESIQAFFAGDYQISPQSQRMGYRLSGQPLQQHSDQQLLSAATSFGSVQVPPDGNPIVLMADRQTTGGYAKIAHVATVDLPLLAQGMPGETLRFMEIELDQARELDGRLEQAFAGLKLSLAPLRQLFD